MATATATSMMMLLSQWLTWGRVASSCTGNVQHCGRGNTLPPPPGHKGVCIAQRCAMEVPLQRVSAPFQGGGILTAHHGFFFQTTVQFTKQPFVPPHHSGTQEPCQPIDALPPQLLLHLFVKVSLGRACIVCWWHAALWQGWHHCKEVPPPPPPPWHKGG